MATGDDNNSGIPTPEQLQQQREDIQNKREQLKMDEDLTAAKQKLAVLEERMLKAIRANKTEKIAGYQKEIELINNAIASVDQHEKSIKSINEALLDQAGAMSTLEGSLGGVSSMMVGMNGLYSKHKKQLEEIDELGPLVSPEETEQLKKHAAAMRNLSMASMAIAPIAGLFDNVFAKMKELAIAEIDAERNLQKLYHQTENAAEAFAKLETKITASGESLISLGIHTGKLYETFEDLRGQFTLLSGDAGSIPAFRDELIGAAAVLEKVGIAVHDTGAAANTMNRIFGEEDIPNFVANLNEIGIANGLGPGQLVSTFNELSPQIMKIGTDTGSLTKTMSNLAYASRQTGIEMGRIVDFASEFDTFEGAADRVGKLNAILGGDFVNVMDLMAAEDPAERFQMITDAINGQIGSFKDLTYYEKLALTEAAGFSDVSELALAMQGRFDLLNNSVQDNAKAYEDAAQHAKDFQTFQEQMEAVMVSLAKQPGFSNAVKSGINLMLSFMQTVAEHGKMFIWVLMTAKSASIALAVAQLYLAAGGEAAKLALGRGTGLFGILMAIGTLLIIGMSPPLIDTIYAFAAAILAVAVAARIGGKGLNMGLVKVMLALGAAVLMATGGIALAAEGISSMADSVSNLNSEQLAGFNNALIGLVGTLALFTTGIVLLGIFATGPQMLGILGIGAAFLMIGVGIGAAAAGMGALAEGFAKLFDTGASGGAFLAMAGGIYAMAASLTVFAAALVILTPAMMIFSAGMALSNLIGAGPDEEEIQAFGKMVEGLASINADNMTRTVDQVARLRQEMSAMMESPDMVKDFTDMLEVFERDMKLAYDIDAKQKANQKAELTINSPITVRISDDVALMGKIEETVVAKMNFTK